MPAKPGSALALRLKGIEASIESLTTQTEFLQEGQTSIRASQDQLGLVVAGIRTDVRALAVQQARMVEEITKALTSGVSAQVKEHVHALMGRCQWCKEAENGGGNGSASVET